MFLRENCANEVLQRAVLLPNCFSALLPMPTLAPQKIKNPGTSSGCRRKTFRQADNIARSAAMLSGVGAPTFCTDFRPYPLRLVLLIPGIAIGRLISCVSPSLFPPPPFPTISLHPRTCPSLSPSPHPGRIGSSTSHLVQAKASFRKRRKEK